MRGSKMTIHKMSESLARKADISACKILFERELELYELTDTPIADLRLAWKIYNSLINIIERNVDSNQKTIIYKSRKIWPDVIGQNNKIKLTNNEIEKINDVYKISVPVEKQKNIIDNVVFNIISSQNNNIKGFYDDQTKEITLPYINNSENVLDMSSIAMIFKKQGDIIHELIHWIDDKKGVLAHKTVSDEEYYNSEDEINAFTQQLLIYMRNFLIRSSNGEKYLEHLQTTDTIEEFIMYTINSIMNLDYGNISILELKNISEFLNNLTPENQKRVYQQLEKYTKEALSKIKKRKKESIEDKSIIVFEVLDEIIYKLG